MPEPNPNKHSETDKKIGFKTYYSELIKDFLDLDRGVDKWATIKDIKSKQSMSGANAWMLLCSIMIACIGLNMNSQAVIIGGMLISPLMSPILGIGLAVGINDKDALYNALMHFFAALVIAFIASFVYFSMTPLKEFTEEISARTQPNFLDILIAIFGGIAGIISTARKDISTTLPGVAIATALMPPLCVAGYGLANANLAIASKAFYLFFLNSFFVALATYVIVRLMKFPHKEHASPKDRMKNIKIISVFSILMIIPSVWLFSTMVKKYKEKQKLNFFIDKYLGDDKKYLDNYELFVNKDAGNRSLVLKVYGQQINESLIPKFKMGLDSLDMKDVDVQVLSTSEINLEKFKKLESNVTEVDNVLNQRLDELKEEKNELYELIKDKKNERNFFNLDSSQFFEVCKNARIFMPEIKEISMAVSQSNNFQTIKSEVPTVIIRWEDPDDEDIQKLENYFKDIYNLDTVKLVIH